VKEDPPPLHKRSNGLLRDSEIARGGSRVEPSSPAPAFHGGHYFIANELAKFVRDIVKPYDQLHESEGTPGRSKKSDAAKRNSPIRSKTHQSGACR